MSSSVVELESPARSHASERSLRTIRVALAGCGAVGGALSRLITQRRTEIAAQHALDVEIVHVLVRDPHRDRDVPIDRSLFTSDPDIFLASEADVVIEAIGGLDPAAHIAESTLWRGGSFITANKALVARHGKSLLELARRGGGFFRFDAAVGGGVPAVRLIDDALGCGSPRRISAILNGTSNFVLTLLERGATLESALDDARRRGFAESDATRDLDGSDAADKIAILAWRAFGVDPATLPVRRQGLLPRPERLVHLARAVDGRIRLLAECELVDGNGVVASVEPAIVPTLSPFGRTECEDNRLEIDLSWAAPLAAAGPGAGGLPTATAMLSDLVASTPTPFRRHAAPRAAKDERSLDWHVEARCAPATLVHALEDVGIVVSAYGTRSRDTWADADGAPWDLVERALSAPAMSGSNPVAVRRFRGSNEGRLRA